MWESRVLQRDFQAPVEIVLCFHGSVISTARLSHESSVTSSSGGLGTAAEQAAFFFSRNR
jgi:hypothetical protein